MSNYYDTLEYATKMVYDSIEMQSPAVVVDDTTTLEECGFDSVDALDIMNELEDRLDIILEEFTAELTVNDIIDKVMSAIGYD